MGQEVLVGLGERPSLKHSIKPVAAFATRGATTLSLPFLMTLQNAEVFQIQVFGLQVQ